ncbi:MAG TPA: hypothetical protein PKC20_19060 [Burkholderiaceae bacterium]|nr:hypothetical protein [Burkholderiaceae bacterium]
MARHRHHVYVVLLDDVVMNDRRFASATRGGTPPRPGVSGGTPGPPPGRRPARHKAGAKANRFVREHGLRLMPELYAYANPMPYAAAREMEVELALGLRAEGYAVWQA